MTQPLGRDVARLGHKEGRSSGSGPNVYASSVASPRSWSRAGRSPGSVRLVRAGLQSWCRTGPACPHGTVHLRPRAWLAASGCLPRQRRFDHRAVPAGRALGEQPSWSGGGVRSGLETSPATARRWVSRCSRWPRCRDRARQFFRWLMPCSTRIRCAEWAWRSASCAAATVGAAQFSRPVGGQRLMATHRAT